MADTHSISGYASSATSAVSASSSWYDHGQDEDAFAASGSDSSTGDSGTTDGSNDQELARLTNFDTGGNENSTATQTAPTSRAEQQGGVAMGTGAGPPGEGPNGGDGGYYDDGGQRRPIGGDGGGDGEEDGDGEDGGDGLAPDGYPYPTIVPLNQEPLAATPYTGPFENPREDPDVPSPGDPAPQDSGPPPANPAPGSQTPPPQTGQTGYMVVPDPPLEIGASQPLIGLDDQTGGDWGDDSGGSGGILGYVGNSLKQAVLGNYTPGAQRNGLGTVAEIAVGFVPIAGTVAAGRDAFQDVTNWQWTLGHALRTCGDLAGLFPFVRGFVKGGRAALGGAKFAQGASTASRAGPLFSRGVRGVESASEDLIKTISSKGRSINYATEGSEELRYLDAFNANANVGGETMTHILLRQDATKIEVLEEFLHGTQLKAGIIGRLGLEGAEVQVKQFMINHSQLLGISSEDVQVLKQLLGE